MQTALRLKPVSEVRSNTEAAAFTGGLVGGIAGLAASLMGVGVPLMGSLGAMSPMLTALTGACAGALAGGLLGALTDIFVSPQQEDGSAPSRWVARTNVLPGESTAENMTSGGRGALDMDQRVANWRDSGWTGFNSSALPGPPVEGARETSENAPATSQNASVSLTPKEAERERRLYGMHTDPLTGLPVTADPEQDNFVAETIRR